MRSPSPDTARTRIVLAIAIAGALALSASGCGASAGAGHAGPMAHGRRTGDAPPALRVVMGKSGTFETVVPKGFRVPGGSQAAAAPIEYLAVGPTTGGFATNIDILRQRNPGLAVSTVARDAVKEIALKVPGAHGFSRPRALAVAGEPAAEVSFVQEPLATLVLRDEQVYVARGAWIYTITYTAPDRRYTAELPALSSVLGAWKWR